MANSALLVRFGSKTGKLQEVGKFVFSHNKFRKRQAVPA